jgi:hypothetical protein
MPAWLTKTDGSLPKGGPVQTSYEEKLWLYSLYKQGTCGVALVFALNFGNDAHAL